MAKVHTNTEDFKDEVLAVVCRYAGVESAAFVADMRIDEIGLGEFGILEIMQKVESKLHIVINDTCLDGDLNQLTVAQFAEILQANIV
ncbi:MAG TPA: hypothetical protein VL947_14270 [Cytophagales bacterium]|nr:hypothetical protein [Cytophagales bacterium]